jgi:uncharacterized SAM-binding protein YcdF (DUF218 family)
MDIIIVLGAQNDQQGRLSAMALARAQGALEQYRSRPGARLLATGGHGHFNPAPQPHAYYMATYLIEQGVDPNDILARVESAHTVEDAALTRRVLGAFIEPGHEDAPSAAKRARSYVRSIVVVTSEVHVPRAQLIFQHFYDPARLTFVGTPDAVPPERLRELRAHEAEQLERIRRQGGVLYRGRLVRRLGSRP